jgi:energy-coupling factor transporter ATP-binding protein EcfA2
MITIVKNKEPNLKRPTFLVDGKLDTKLDKFALTSLMNKSNFTLFLGKPGSGKTSMIVSLLDTPELFKGVYHTIYLFMGKNSRSSIKGSFFDEEIPPDQIFDELNIENLNNIYERIKQDADDGYRSLIIADDVQKSLKDHEVEKLFLQICNNRRHLKLSIWCANQNYMALSRSVRMGLTDIFAWKVNKTEFENLFNEQVEMHKDKFARLLTMLFKNPHDFFYINTETKRMFSNWNEIKILDT